MLHVSKKSDNGGASRWGSFTLFERGNASMTTVPTERYRTVGFHTVFALRARVVQWNAGASLGKSVAALPSYNKSCAARRGSEWGEAGKIDPGSCATELQQKLRRKTWGH
jgi:hypothetical protein